MSTIQEQVMHYAEAIKAYCECTECDKCILHCGYNCTLIVSEPCEWDIAECKANFKILSDCNCIKDDPILRETLSRRGFL